MTYSLHTLNSSRSSVSPARSGWGRFADELGLLAGLVLLAFWLIALLSYSTQDVAWSTSGSGGPLLNRAGHLGAWLAYGSYFLLGFSVWWCLAAGVRAWLSGLARWLRGHELMMPQDEPAASLTSRFTSGRMAFWGSFYQKLFNFREIRYFDIQGEYTGLTSRAMTAPDGKNRIPLNEESRPGGGQIE